MCISHGTCHSLIGLYFFFLSKSILSPPLSLSSTFSSTFAFELAGSMEHNGIGKTVVVATVFLLMLLPHKTISSDSVSNNINGRRISHVLVCTVGLFHLIV